MEKSRAIELLKLAVPIKALTQQEYADFVEAVNMGMDALEQPTSPDMIDRKAALDALRKCQTYLYDARDPELKIKLSSAKAAINSLPTIQPEKAQLSKEGTTSDMISRQAVKHLDLFAKTFCRDKSVKDDLVFRCKQCEFEMPDGKCLVKVMARKLCPDYKDFGAMGDL